MTEERIIAYFLGELTEEETEQFEAELFDADEFPPEVRAVEDDLIDDYLRDQLTPERRERFEEYYLWSEARRERVAMAAAELRQFDDDTLEDQPEDRNWWEFWRDWATPLRLAAATALLVVIGGAIWLIGFRDRAPRSTAMVFVTYASVTRGDNAPSLPKAVLSGHDEFQLQIAAAPELLSAPEYEAEVRDLAGATVYSGPAVREGNILVVTVPARNIQRGRYEIKLFSVTNGARQPVPGSGIFTAE